MGIVEDQNGNERIVMDEAYVSICLPYKIDWFFEACQPVSSSKLEEIGSYLQDCLVKAAKNVEVLLKLGWETEYSGGGDIHLWRVGIDTEEEVEREIRDAGLDLSDFSINVMERVISEDAAKELCGQEFVVDYDPIPDPMPDGQWNLIKDFGKTIQSYLSIGFVVEDKEHKLYVRNVEEVEFCDKTDFEPESVDICLDDGDVIFLHRNMQLKDAIMTAPIFCAVLDDRNVEITIEPED